MVSDACSRLRATILEVHSFDSSAPLVEQQTWKRRWIRRVAHHLRLIRNCIDARCRPFGTVGIAAKQSRQVIRLLRQHLPRLARPVQLGTPALLARGMPGDGHRQYRLAVWFPGCCVHWRTHGFNATGLDDRLLVGWVTPIVPAGIMLRYRSTAAPRQVRWSDPLVRVDRGRARRRRTASPVRRLWASAARTRTTLTNAEDGRCCWYDQVQWKRPISRLVDDPSSGFWH